MITLDQIASLRYGATLHHVSEKNRDGTPLRCRINGRIKVWKTLPEAERRELKYWNEQLSYTEHSVMFIMQRIADIESMRGKHWRVPVKYGMYECFYIGTTPECDYPEMWELSES